MTNHTASLPNTEQNSIWISSFTLACSANLVMLLGLQLLLPTLPLYLLTIGGSQKDVGFVMGTFTLGAMVMRAISGLLCDRYGRKSILTIGLSLMLASTILYWFADRVSLVGLFRGLHGISFGLAGTAIAAIAADSLPGPRMAEGLGYFGLTATLSMGIAPMIGIWLSGRFGYPVLFYVSSSMAVVTLFSSIMIKSRRADNVKSEQSILKSLANMIEKSALVPSAIMFLLSLVNSSVVYFIAIYVGGLHIGNVGFFFAVNSFFMVVSRPISGRWADRGGNNPVMIIGIGTLLLGLILVSQSQTMAAFLCAGALIGIGTGFSIPTLQALAVRTVPAHRRGAATGTYFAAFDLGFGAGAYIWGIVADLAGYGFMYLMAVIPLAIAAMIYYSSYVRKHNPVTDY
jgi:MFS family permease